MLTLTPLDLVGVAVAAAVGLIVASVAKTIVSTSINATLSVAKYVVILAVGTAAVSIMWAGVSPYVGNMSVTVTTEQGLPPPSNTLSLSYEAAKARVIQMGTPSWSYVASKVGVKYDNPCPVTTMPWQSCETAPSPPPPSPPPAAETPAPPPSTPPTKPEPAEPEKEAEPDPQEEEPEEEEPDEVEEEEEAPEVDDSEEPEL